MNIPVNMAIKGPNMTILWQWNLYGAILSENDATSTDKILQ